MKIGLVVGLGLVAGAVVWVATRPSMTPEARMRQLHETAAVERTGPGEEPNEQPVVSVIARSPKPNLPPPEPVRAEGVPPSDRGQDARDTPAEGAFDSTVHEQTEKIETQRFYIVRRGDTLSRISVTYYGSAGQWRKIFEANRKTIANPDKLTLGQKLIIPE